MPAFRPCFIPTCHNRRGRMLHVQLTSFFFFFGLDQIAVTVVKRDFSIVVVAVAFFVGSLHTSNSNNNNNCSKATRCEAR